MKSSDLGRYSHRIEIIRFETSILPGTTTIRILMEDERLQHLNADVCFLLLDVQSKFATLLDGEVVYLSLFNEFSFGQVLQSFGMRASPLNFEEFLTCGVFDRIGLQSQLSSINGRPV
jgi:hypothetical protein